MVIHKRPKVTLVKEGLVFINGEFLAYSVFAIKELTTLLDIPIYSRTVNRAVNIEGFGVVEEDYLRLFPHDPMML